MALDPQTLLDNTDTAINGLLSILADTAIQEYQLPDGRRIQRAQFGATIDSLMHARAMLMRQISNRNGSRLRVGKLGRNVR